MALQLQIWFTFDFYMHDALRLFTLTNYTREYDKV